MPLPFSAAAGGGALLVCVVSKAACPTVPLGRPVGSAVDWPKDSVGISSKRTDWFIEAAATRAGVPFLATETLKKYG